MIPLLAEAPVRGGYRSTEIVAADPVARTLLLQTMTDSARQPGVALLDVPSGRRRPLPASWATRARWLWQGHVIVDEDDGCGVYDVRSLWRVKRLQR